jgi:hypothetical protein
LGSRYYYSGFVVNDAAVVEKIGRLLQQIIIIMENDDDFTKSINRQVSFDLIFPHSKL